MGNENRDQQKDVRKDDFGDDGGTRVGRPDPAARLSENATTRGLEGAIVEGADENEQQGPGQNKVQRESGRDQR